MYDRSALHVGQKYVFVFTVFFLLYSQIDLFLFSNVNNGHYHGLYYVMYHFILTFLPCSYYFYVSNNALCVTPLLLPFCIILDSFVKCLLYIHFEYFASIQEKQC